MSEPVLILCAAGDLHAFAVAEALRLKGAEVHLWYPSDLPTHAVESFAFTRTGRGVRIDGAEESLGSGDVGAVWNRRVRNNLELGVLHPSDELFAQIQRQRFRDGSMRVAYQDAFWVNPWAASQAAESKLYQFSQAVEAGLRTPATLFTNDPAAVRDFLRAHGGEIVYKPFAAVSWTEGTRCWVPYTIALDESRLVADPLLRAVPGIYQEKVPKAFEIRLTMIGRRGLAAKILSQETSEGRDDWRLAYQELRMEQTLVPSLVQEQCWSLLERLDLVFGCFDFIVTPDGEYVFLEVNQQGQFLFVERACGLPLLDAFCELLLQANVDYEWDARRIGVSYSAVEAAAQQRAAASRGRHAVVWAPFTEERPEPARRRRRVKPARPSPEHPPASSSRGTT